MYGPTCILIYDNLGRLWKYKQFFVHIFQVGILWILVVAMMGFTLFYPMIVKFMLFITGHSMVFCDESYKTRPIMPVF